jgi:hypothetical protein
MANFEDREKGFEAKFAFDEEVKFKITARRNKLLGLWAAEQMGLSADKADAYARDVVAADLEEAGEDDVLRKIASDLKAKGVKLSEHRIRREMDALLETARRQILEDQKPKK